MSAERPFLLCYDGSDFAKQAIRRAGELLPPGPAVVLTVWESVAKVALSHGLPGSFGVVEDVIEELDQSTLGAAEELAAEGAELAGAAGFQAEPLAHRALVRTGQREAVTIWEAIVDVAEQHDAAAIVLGSRGLSGVKSALLGSVSYGVVHHAPGPVVIVPAASEG